MTISIFSFFKKAPEPKIGDVYWPTDSIEDPFNARIYKIKIVDIKENIKGKIWVRYVFVHYPEGNMYEQEWESFYRYGNLEKCKD